MAFDNRNVLNCIESVHKYLGSKYLDTDRIFKNIRTNRKEEVGASQSKDLRQLNLKLRKCLRLRLSSLYISRGDLHHSQHKYHSAVLDFQQSLEFNLDKTINYQIYHKLAQSQAKLGYFSRAQKNLSLSISSLDDSSLDDKTRNKFRKVLISVSVSIFSV